MSKMAEKRLEFWNKAVECYPHIEKDQAIARQEMLYVMDELGLKSSPSWVKKNPIERGLYRLLPEGDGQESPAPAMKAKASAPAAPAPEPAAPSADVNSFVSFADDPGRLVPSKDKNYVAFGHHKDLKTVIKSEEFYPIYISGPSGNGKSTMVEQVCAELKRPCIRINLNNMTDEDQLIGTKTLEDGNVEIVEGPVLIAMRTGAVLILDEVDAGAANTLMCLQPVLEGKPIYFKLKNEMVVPARGFTIVATANTKGKGSEDGRYVGTNVLNDAFLERFALSFDQGFPTASAEKRIANKLMGSLGIENNDFLENTVKWVAAIRDSYLAGAIDDMISTRRLVHVIRAYAIFKDERKAVELCCNRFDPETKDAFMKVFDAVHNKEEEPDPNAEPEKSAPSAENEYF